MVARVLDLFGWREREFVAVACCPVCALPWQGHDNEACEAGNGSPSEEAINYRCGYCGAQPGAKCFTRHGECLFPHQTRIDAAERPTLHWLVSYGPQGEPLSEQCSCHLPYDHYADGGVVR